MLLCILLYKKQCAIIVIIVIEAIIVIIICRSHNYAEAGSTTGISISMTMIATVLIIMAIFKPQKSGFPAFDRYLVVVVVDVV